jgi:small subunit ribosomal protein S17
MRSKNGTVVTAKDKTVVVRVDTYRIHEKYKKRYRVSKKFHAHDEKNECKVGEKITIYETRPVSKLKRWTTDPSAAKVTESTKDTK